MSIKSIPVILDTDIGSDVDDTWALALLLKCPELNLKMVLTDTGDTEYRAKLTAKYLEIAGRADIPVAIGIPFEDKQKFQEAWVEGYELLKYPGLIHKDGVRAFVEMVMNSPEKMTLIAISATPNLAAALEMEPRIADKLRVVGMFGSVYKGYNGSSQPEPEANVRYHCDSFKKFYAGFPDMTITPVDTCGLVRLTGPRYEKVRDSQDPTIKALMEIYRIWAKNVTWERGIDTQVTSSTLFDTVAVYMAITEELLEMRELGLSVDDTGMMRVDEAAKKARVAIDWKNLDAFYEWLVGRLTSQ